MLLYSLMLDYMYHSLLQSALKLFLHNTIQYNKDYGGAPTTITLRALSNKFLTFSSSSLSSASYYVFILPLSDCHNLHKSD